jgi:VanZ family protein
MSRFFAWLLFFLWFVGINILSSLPGSSIPSGPEIPHFDKFAHFVIFFAGAFLLDNALRKARRPLGFPRFLLSFGIVLAIGIADELRQLLTPGRDGACPYDMLANLLGALAGAYFSLKVHARIRRPHPFRR